MEHTRVGRGPVADLAHRTNALQSLQAHQARLRSFVLDLTSPATGVVRAIAGGVTALLTIAVLAYLIALEGPRVVEGASSLLDPDRSDRIRAVGAGCARSITGYLSGNLAISVICGLHVWARVMARRTPGWSDR
jgi:predicted PurR-regulated permease PerM